MSNTTLAESAADAATGLKSSPTSFIIVAPINAAFIIVTTLLFILRRSHPEIRRNSFILTLIQSFSNLVFSTTILLLNPLFQIFPGFVLFWVTAIFILLWILCVLGQGLRLLALYEWNDRRLSISEALRDRLLSISNSTSLSDKASAMAEALAVKSNRGGRRQDKRGRSRSRSHIWVVDENEPGQNPDEDVTRRVLKTIALAIGAQMLGCLALQIALPDPVRIIPKVAVGRQMVSLFVSHLLTTYIVAGLYLVVCSPIMIYLLWNVKDANGIRNQIVTTIVIGIPFFIMWFLLIFVRNGPHSVLREVLPAPYYPFLLFLIAHITSIVIPLIKSYTSGIPTRKKVGYNALTSLERGNASKQPKSIFPWRTPKSSPKHSTQRVGRTAHRQPWWHRLGRAASSPTEPLLINEYDFRRVLDDPLLFPSFKKFSASDFSIEPALFHESHIFLRRAVHLMVASNILPPCGTMQVTDDDLSAAAGLSGKVSPRGAVVGQFSYIWETFVKDGALMEVKELSAAARDRVREGLSSGVYTADLFDEVAEENFKIMYENVYPKFVRFHNTNQK
ncbi:hypothetical protein BC829DRAFT_398439 [Chytridium lagenaria]|nr:hypothetical protein BC829DRAFT_398439 [Chytridium lagenaria]